jgi:hypothetical protein
LKLDLITKKDGVQSHPPSTLPSTADIAAARPEIAANEKRSERIANNLKTSSTPTIHNGDDSLDLDNIAHPVSPETLRHVHKWLRIASIFFVVAVVVTLVL